MSILDRLNSNLLIIIFNYSHEKTKLKILKYNKSLQAKIYMSLYDYQKYFFFKNNYIPKITKENIFNFYEYLKRHYSNIYQSESIKAFFSEFFCKFLSENDIDYELDSSNELIFEILSCKYLKKIKILINVDNYKKEYVDLYEKDKNLKPFFKLIRYLFKNPKLTKIIIK